MKLIKLNAIDSTNDFLKRLSSDSKIINFTVVTAENQTNGKGQMGAEWITEEGKNLIMSVLIKDFIADADGIFNLNIAFSMSVIEALNGYNIPKLSIKWPNDIMSDNKKLGGILIENSIKSDSTIISIVGLGLNINQTNFNNLPNASSLSNVCNSIFDKVEILNRIIEQLKINILNWDEKSTTLKQKYINSLFKKGVPMPFQDNNLLNFMGIIQGVTPIGKLEILLENDTTQEYDIKEIKMLY